MKKCSKCSYRKRIDNIKEEPGYAIVGNMNVGKSTFCSRLCGHKTESINMPGTTISIKKFKSKSNEITFFDMPGICSMFALSEDARVSRDLLLFPERTGEVRGIIVVADAKHVKRSIAIALQYSEFGLPIILNVNMIDEAVSRGIDIDYEKLSSLLGIEISQTVASDGIGISKMVSKLKSIQPRSTQISYPRKIERFVALTAKLFGSGSINPSRALGLLLLARDRSAREYVIEKFGHSMMEQLNHLVDEYHEAEPVEARIVLADLYFKEAEKITKQVERIDPPSKSPFLVKFGDWCTRFSTGIPIALGILVLMYYFVGSFGATFLVDTINGVIFNQFLIPITTKLIEPLPSPFFRDMIIDPDFGILPTGIFLALGLVLPVLFCFYIAFGILENSGYLPRLSILLNKWFRMMGLNGKGVIPLVMGFSCVTMAILTTRMLDTKKEKNIATLLLLLGMPCAPLLAVMLIVLEKMPISATFTVFGIIFTQIFIAGFIADKLLPGRPGPLFLEIPPMRIPQLTQVVKIAAIKTFFFMKEAVPVFVMASLIVFLFDRIGGLAILEDISRPLISDFMGLPEKSVQVFIKTIIRRESGAAELEHVATVYTNLQIVVNLLVMTFLSPCINAAIVLFKERGAKAGIAIMVTVSIYAICVGSLVNYICRWLGITFS